MDYNQKLLSIIAGGLLLAQFAFTGDWPRFLGPNGNGTSSETGINKDWSTKPPAELWRTPLTDGGFSGPSVKSGVVYLLDHAGEEDIVRAIKLQSGEELWRYVYTESGSENYGFTRATPTVDEERVYTISRTGVIHCLSTSDGTKLWRVDAVKNNGGEPPPWFMANSAVIDGERLVTIAAGPDAHVVVLDKHTGKNVWAGGGTGKAGYATPVVATLDGKKQYLVFAAKALLGVAAADGAVLWRHPWKTSLDANIPSPIVVGDDLLWMASGYRSGCALLRIRGAEVEEIWKESRISPHWSSAILIDGHLYTTTAPGYLVCVEARTGEQKWRTKGNARGFEHGGLCAVDGTLIVVEGNTGNVVQVALSPSEYRELGRISPLDSANCWVAPIVAEKKLLVRSPKELVCLDIGPL